MAKSCPEKGKGKQGQERSRERTREKGKGKVERGWRWIQKGKGKEKGLQSMNDEYTSVAKPSVSCGETQSPDRKMASEEWQVPMKRVKSTGIKTGEGNRQFVCNSKFEAIAEQNRAKR